MWYGLTGRRQQRNRARKVLGQTHQFEKARRAGPVRGAERGELGAGAGDLRHEELAVERVEVVADTVPEERRKEGSGDIPRSTRVCRYDPTAYAHAWWKGACVEGGCRWTRTCSRTRRWARASC